MQVIEEVYVDVTQGLTLRNDKLIQSDLLQDSENFNFEENKISILCQQGSLTSIDGFLN